jgi:hypothetical protein
MKDITFSHQGAFTLLQAEPSVSMPLGCCDNREVVSDPVEAVFLGD